MNDVLPLLPIPQLPMGRSSYNIPCPVCDHTGSRKRHLNINLKRNVFRCPKCGQFEDGVFDLYAYYTGVPQDKVRQERTGWEAEKAATPANQAGRRKPSPGQDRQRCHRPRWSVLKQGIVFTGRS